MPLKFKTNLDIAAFRAAYDYDPDTGAFFSHRSNRSVGKTTSHGYLALQVQKGVWCAHRLAWAWVHGELPKGELDHINRDKRDNRIANLREASRYENAVNRDYVRSRGAIGATYHKHTGKWQAQIMRDGKNTYLGQYPTKEEASRVYLAARKAG